MLRNPATRHGVVYRCAARTVFLVVSRIAIAHFRSEKIQGQISQKTTPNNDYFRAVRITEASVTIDVDMIHRIVDEILYRWDTYGVTRENHIEHL
jgi:hypothetical protein